MKSSSKKSKKSKKGGSKKSKKSKKGGSKKSKNWSQVVTLKSRSMIIPDKLFTWAPEKIAKGLKKASISSKKTKGTKFSSAMSLLNFYINRAGSNLKSKDKKRLEKAKTELRKVFKVSIK